MKYTFSDIEIYMKVEADVYLDISNYSLALENRTIRFNGFKSNKKFAISFCNYVKKKKTYVCEATIEDLLALASIRDKSFKNRFFDEDGENEEILALFCARKIVDYNYGKVQSKENSDDIYTFHRMGWEYDGAKKKRKYPIVMTGKFQKVYIEKIRAKRGGVMI